MELALQNDTCWRLRWAVPPRVALSAPLHVLLAQYRLQYASRRKGFHLAARCHPHTARAPHVQGALTDCPRHPIKNTTFATTDMELRHRPYWDRIWDCFAAELTGLLTLYVDECHDDREYRVHRPRMRDHT